MNLNLPQNDFLLFMLYFTEDHYSNTPSNRPYSLQPPQLRAPLVGQNGNNGNGTEEVWLRQGEGRSSGESLIPLKH